jgi:hypothetical protein
VEVALVAEAVASAVLVVVVSVAAVPVEAGKDFQNITSKSDICYFNSLTHAGFLF